MYKNAYIFPERLKSLRDAIGVSQTEFAAYMGISRASLSYYENGERIPDIKFLIDLHVKTGCSLYYLLGYTSAMREANQVVNSLTGLSDDAIFSISDMETDIVAVNKLIEHPRFHQLIKAIGIMMNVNSVSTPFTETTTFFEYELFTVISILKEIAIETREKSEVDINSPWTDIQLAHNELEHYRVTSSEVDTAIKERLEKLKPVAEKISRQKEESISKHMVSDPFFRFYHKMTDDYLPSFRVEERSITETAFNDENNTPKGEAVQNAQQASE